MRLEHPGRAAIAARRAGVLFAIATVLFAAASHGGAIAATALLGTAVLVHTSGELLQAGSGFGLSFALADPRSHGEYQGIWNLGDGLGESAGPVLLTAVAIGFGIPGWLVIGAMFAAAGAMMPVLVPRQKAGRQAVRPEQDSNLRPTA